MEKQNKNDKKYILGFSLIPEIGPSKFKKIFKHFPSLEAAWNCQSSKAFTQAGISENISEKIVQKKQAVELEKHWQTVQKENIQIISSYFDIEFPGLLKEIAQCPFALFCRGNLSLLKKKQIAIVGSRKSSPYGEQVCQKIIPELVYAGLTITSGLAFGIDSLAHKTALENDGQAIAVLGSGNDDRIIKKSHSYQLAQRLLNADSLIVTEYPPGFEASKFTFPQRNRIISGLSLGVLVVEAGLKSGSLITANCALEQNREIFAVPGNIFSPQSAGTNQLISQGAKLVCSANSILESLNFIPLENTATREEIVFENPQEKQIYSFLSFEPINIDKIAKLTKLDPSDVATKLSMMELSGSARNIGGGMFIKG